MYVLVRMQLRNNVDAQPLKRFKGYKILSLECCKCARRRFHRANGLVLLCSCAR